MVLINSVLKEIAFFTYDHRLVPIQETQRLVGLDRECLFHKSSDTMICIGSLEVGSGKDVKWYASIGSRCGSEQALNFAFNISIYAFETVECKRISDAFNDLQIPVPANVIALKNGCATTYPLYSSFNAIGISELGYISSIQFLLRTIDSPCYQHIDFMACGLFFPECNNGNVTMVCSEMCEEMLVGCSDVLGLARCNSLGSKENSTCLYLSVDCGDPPESPNHAELVFENGTGGGAIRQFECRKGYRSHGLPTHTCSLNGNWLKDDSFECIKRSTNAPVILTTTICTGVLIVTAFTLTIVALKFKIELRLLKGKCTKRGIFSKRRGTVNPQKLYHACIVCHECFICEDYAKWEIQERLETIGYKIYSNYSAPDLGSNMVSRKPEIIGQSYCVIVILNQHFLDSHWCKYELEHSFIQLIEDNDFDILLILTEDPSSLKGVPRYLKAYLRTNLYMRSTDPTLIEQLCTELPEAASIHTDPTDVYQPQDEAIGLCNLDALN